jgi:uncharacterized protein (TIGR02466 family)
VKIEITPQILHKYTLDGYEELNEFLLSEAYSLKESLPGGIKSSNYGGWHSPRIFGKEVKKFNNITSKILDYVKKDIFIDTRKATLTSLWFNINKPGDSNVLHNHGGARYSGVYYIKTPENCGDLAFTKKDIADKHNYKEYKFTPSEGDLYIFRGFIWHRALENSSNEDRVSCSFNIVG